MVSAPPTDGFVLDDVATRQSGVQVGDLAPDFQGSAPSEIQGAKLRGELLLIYFWASWCKSCELEISEVHDLYGSYGELGLEVIGVNIDLDRMDMEEFLRNHSTIFFIFQDRNMVNVNAWDPRGMSAIYLVSEAGRVIFAHTGSDLEGHAGPDFEELEQVIKRSLDLSSTNSNSDRFVMN